MLNSIILPPHSVHVYTTGRGGSYPPDILTKYSLAFVLVALIWFILAATFEILFRKEELKDILFRDLLYGSAALGLSKFFLLATGLTFLFFWTLDIVLKFL